ncbi:helix-turn-helix transcriptional regulator [bacterium]|nr:helix-turn-helix transcriptional regulator [bacterium]
MDISISFGKRLQKLRKARHLTQAQLSELVDIDVTSISKIENGTTFPKKENIEKFANILGCEIKDLFDFSKDDITTKQQILKNIEKKLLNAKIKDLKFFNKVIDAYIEDNF